MKVEFDAYTGPAGGWGSVRSLADRVTREGNPISAGLTLMHQNKPRGFSCPSCAWAKPAKPHLFEFCENGAKATIWELTQNRATPDFFARHSLRELESWDDHALEATGRLTHPLRYDAASDRYVPVPGSRLSAGSAPPAPLRAELGGVLRLRPRLAGSRYMYQLLARLYGTNNLPDCSNMCHETTSVALPREHRRAGRHGHAGRFPPAPMRSSSSARMSAATALACCTTCRRRARRGVPIVTFNPLRERGLEALHQPAERRARC